MNTWKRNDITPALFPSLPSPKKRNKNSCVGSKTVWNVHMSRLGLHGAPPGWLTGCSVTGEQDSTTRKASLIIRTEANKEVHQPAHRLWEQRKKRGGVADLAFLRCSLCSGEKLLLDSRPQDKSREHRRARGRTSKAGGVHLKVWVLVQRTLKLAVHVHKSTCCRGTRFRGCHSSPRPPAPGPNWELWAGRRVALF